jgi:hypothetical protein
MIRDGGCAGFRFTDTRRETQVLHSAAMRFVQEDKFLQG